MDRTGGWCLPCAFTEHAEHQHQHLLSGELGMRGLLFAELEASFLINPQPVSRSSAAQRASRSQVQAGTAKASSLPAAGLGAKCRHCTFSAARSGVWSQGARTQTGAFECSGPAARELRAVSVLGAVATAALRSPQEISLLSCALKKCHMERRREISGG